MKTGLYIIVVLLLALGFGLAGYFLAKSGKKDTAAISYAPDREFIAQADSFKKAILGKEDSLELLKMKLSSYSRNEKKHTPPSIDTLLSDINTFQHIVRDQDTLRAIEAKQITFIQNKLIERTDQLATLQNRYNKDIDRQKKTRVNIFLSGVGVGAGATILIAILIL